jgi:hypothetical protein
MREGIYEVVVLRADGSRCEEQVVGGRTHVIAEPGQEFVVRVMVHKDAAGRFDHDMYRVGLYVDGHDVNYWKRIDTSATRENYAATSFYGFKKNVQELRAFTFAETVMTDRTHVAASASADSSLGTIRVEIFKARPSNGIFQNNAGYHEMPDSTRNISETKKFWTQPSVTTRAGRKVFNEQFNPLQRWENINSTPDHVSILQYHTRELVALLRTIHEQKLAPEGSPAQQGARQRARDASTLPGAKRPRVVVVDLTGDDAPGEQHQTEDDGEREAEGITVVEAPPPEVPVVSLEEEEEAMRQRQRSNLAVKSEPR